MKKEITIEEINKQTRLEWDGDIEAILNQTEEEREDNPMSIGAQFSPSHYRDTRQELYYVDAWWNGTDWQGTWSEMTSGAGGDLLTEDAPPREAHFDNPLDVCLGLERMWRSEIDEHFKQREFAEFDSKAQSKDLYEV